jgi:hypothetical protein
MEGLIDQTVQMVGAMLAAALVAVLVKLFQRFGIALDQERQDQLQSVARQAVARAEEWGATQLKGLAKRKLPALGAEKFERAVTDVVARIPRVSREEAEAVVQAALPQMGLGAAAGAAALGKALRTK